MRDEAKGSSQMIQSKKVQASMNAGTSTRNVRHPQDLGVEVASVEVASVEVLGGGKAAASAASAACISVHAAQAI